MKLSIITVNLNNKEGLQRTIQSVACQTFRNYEFIVIDGDSTDGSKQLIKENANLFSYHISEKDSGIYGGMNKGIAQATGNYCLFLNSGDWLVNEHVLMGVDAHLDLVTDIVYGNLIKIDPITMAETKAKPPLLLNFSYFYSGTLPHQASFIKTSLFSEIGPYNESFRIAADWVFFTMAICKFERSYKYIDIDVSKFMMDGLGSIKSNMSKITEEKKRIFIKHFKIFANDYEDYDAIKDLQVVKFWKYIQHTSLYKAFKKLG